MYGLGVQVHTCICGTKRYIKFSAYSVRSIFIPAVLYFPQTRSKQCMEKESLQKTNMAAGGENGIEVKR
jgi:hypothetical protein